MLKVGDTVLVNESYTGTDIPAGKAGTIIKTNAGYIWPYEVAFNDGYTGLFVAHELSLVATDLSALVQVVQDALDALKAAL